MEIEGNEASVGTFIDEEIVRDRWWNIKEGDVVFDVGAAYGSYALTACPKASKVYAFSPTQDGFDVLSTNIKLNGFTNCQPIMLGLYGRDGYWNERVSQFFEEPLDDELCYWVTTLDKFTAENKIDKIDWLKLDVEGAEAEVIRGASDTIERGIPNILIENHEFKTPGVEAELHRLLDKRYTSVTVPYCGISHSLYTRR